MTIGDMELARLFRYQAPTDPEKVHRYQEIRRAAETFARRVARLTPPGPDQSAAIRKIREAMMTANAAIACAGPPAEDFPNEQDRD